MKETYLSRDFRETAAQRFPVQAKQLNAAFDMRLNALLAENAGASIDAQEAKKMKKEESKQFIRWCILGAIGCGFMAAGDWLLSCIPLQQTDTGLFNRACYLSGSYGLWKPVLTVGLGAIGGFLYYFVVKALNADIDKEYRKAKHVQFLCGIFTVAIALTIHT